MFYDRFVVISSLKIKEVLFRSDLVRMLEFGQDKDGNSHMGNCIFLFSTASVV
jgi:hypothetical protein